MSGVFAFRFDVDSVTCIERGIPRLRRLADRLAVRFTFFVNMGYSFNWSHNLRHLLHNRRASAGPTPASPRPRASLPTSGKLGWGGVLKTVLLNPALGERYRSVFDALHADGHELGLHGGMDHVIWQRSLDDLDAEAMESIFRPAYRRFSERYGAPSGFASPGFRFNQTVLDLLDTEGFDYASDMSGEAPFQPVHEDGRTYRHFQVPVNVLGEGNVPLVEQGRARGRTDEQIQMAFLDAVTSRDHALAYGHPYVEGVEADLLGQVLEKVADTHEIVTVAEYLEHWRTDHG